jgi:hypothetical protein
VDAGLDANRGDGGCSTFSDCPAGYACAHGSCTTCSVASPCNGGCCTQGSCASGMTPTACATMGSGRSCEDCTVSQLDYECVVSGGQLSCGCTDASNCGPNMACDQTTHLCTKSCGPSQPCNLGCCSAGSCVIGHDVGACGATGNACKDCSSDPAGHGCVFTSGGGYCGCFEPSECPPATACFGNQCSTTCNPASAPCNGGCCGDAGACVEGHSASACGSTGVACVACSGATPSCSASPDASGAYVCQ